MAIGLGVPRADFPFDATCITITRLLSKLLAIKLTALRLSSVV
jgi:hypothetical protein